MDDSELLFSEVNALGIITLNRVKALNALTLSMINALYNQLVNWEANSTIEAIVIKSASPTAFCAGGDVRGLYNQRDNRALQLSFFKAEYQLNLFISQLTKPYIALIDGITFGGGIGISLHGQYPLVSEKASFALPEVGIGLFPDIGASYLLNQCPGYLGYYLGLTGHRLSAQDALKIGWIHGVVSTDSWNQLISQLESMQLNHETIIQYLHPSKLDNPSSPSLSLDLDKINYFFKFPTLLEILDHLKRSEDPWAQETHNNLIKQSPLSLEVTFNLLKKTALYSLQECLELDYQLVHYFMNNRDFYEGVRAQLIDKDKTPIWEPHQWNVLPEELKIILE